MLNINGIAQQGSHLWLLKFKLIKITSNSSLFLATQ